MDRTSSSCGLPYLKFSDLLPETHLSFYLALACQALSHPGEPSLLVAYCVMEFKTVFCFGDECL